MGETQTAIPVVDILREARGHLAVAGVPRGWLRHGNLNYSAVAELLMDDADVANSILESQGLVSLMFREDTRDALKAEVWKKPVIKACSVMAVRLARIVLNGIEDEAQVREDETYFNAVRELAITIRDGSDFIPLDVYGDYNRNALTHELHEVTSNRLYLTECYEGAVIAVNDNAVHHGRPDIVMDLFDRTIKRLSAS